MTEDPLKAARRYVHRGQERLRQQAILVEELLQEGQLVAAARSKKLLVEMQHAQLERQRWLLAEELYALQQGIWPVTTAAEHAA